MIFFRNSGEKEGVKRGRKIGGGGGRRRRGMLRGYNGKPNVSPGSLGRRLPGHFKKDKRWK